MQKPLHVARCLLLLLAAGVLPAQQIAPLRTEVPKEQGPEIKLALTAAALALESKDAETFQRHIAHARSIDPFARDALILLLRAAKDNPDAHLLAALDLARAGVDRKGKFKPGRDILNLWPEDNSIVELTRARADAVAAIAKFARSLKSKRYKNSMASPIEARWLLDIARELTATSPQLSKAHHSALNASLRDFRAEHKVVVTGLLRVAMNAAGAGRWDEAIRTARCILGLAAQSRFQDLEGPKAPNLSAAAAEANRILGTARAALKEQADPPLTVQQMSEMTAEEREAFTEAHSSFGNPGVALSPNARYRIETSCGFETLLAAAESVEFHHERLVRWYGQDPFKNRQGLVRIVPESWGLESEGAPYWWAGGFQGGDTTTIKFALSNVEGMGRTLTHELTHRFDGTLVPFQPSWLVEGKAVWTGAAYAHVESRRFVEEHAKFGTVESAFIKGYGSLGNLTKLIEGTIDDYRDNYVAGYALYLYLKSWEQDGKLLFDVPFQKFMKEAAKGRRKKLAWFEACFVDGKGGRPETLKEFAAGFAAFLKGFYWQSRADWVGRYQGSAGKGRRVPWIYDGPTWHFNRNRAEPWFGQDQALRAGKILLQAGNKKGAAAAFIWALEVDEWPVAAAAALIPLLGEVGEKDRAWVVDALHRKHQREAVLAEQPPLVVAPQLKRMSALGRYLDELTKVQKLWTEGGHATAASAIAADHDRLAELVGRQTLSKTLSIAPATTELDPPSQRLELWGLTEVGLTGYEERRRKGLWYMDARGDLHVGRRRPRKGTGDVDRSARVRDAFVVSTKWQAPGRYMLETRVSFTTSYARGAVILGYNRRDRNVRFGFNAGDYLYSIGVKQEGKEIESVSWNLGGLRGRDGGLNGSNPRGRFKFDGKRTSFRLRLYIDGPEVVAFIDDNWVGNYHTIDALPVDGTIGFATGVGAVRFSQPRVRRLDRSAALGLHPVWPGGLNTSFDSPLLGNQLVNRRCHGIPLADAGTLLVWIPGQEAATDEDDRESWTRTDAVDEAIRTTRGAAEGLNRDRFPLGLVVAIPGSLGNKEVEKVKAALREDPGLVAVVTHNRKTSVAAFGKANQPAEPMPALVLIDSSGVVRRIHNRLRWERKLPWSLWHWSTVLRGRP